MEKEESITLSGKSNIRNTFGKLDTVCPSFAYDFLVELLKMNGAKNVNLNEVILRSEKFLSSDGSYSAFL